MFRHVIAGLAFLGLMSGSSMAQAPATVKLCVQNGQTCTPVNSSNPLPVNASVTASIAGYHPASSLTPITATTGGVTSASFTAGQSILVQNVGSTNAAYCSPGGSATTSSQYIAPGSSAVITTVAETTITCATSASTTTVNFQVGTGLWTGAGGGGGGSGGGTSNITQTAGTNINAAIAATGALPVDVLTTGNLYAAATAPVPCKAGTTPTTQTAVLTGATTAVQCDLNGNVYLPPSQVTTLTPPAWSNSNQIGNTSFGATLQAVASGGWTYKTFVAANSDNATNLKASAGIVHAVQLFGISAATPVWLKFYDTATTPTCASSTIVKQILIPAATTGSGAITSVIDTQFNTGISYCVVGGIATSDDTSVAAATYVANIDYK